APDTTVAVGDGVLPDGSPGEAAAPGPDLFAGAGSTAGALERAESPLGAAGGRTAIAAATVAGTGERGAAPQWRLYSGGDADAVSPWPGLPSAEARRASARFGERTLDWMQLPMLPGP